MIFLQGLLLGFLVAAPVGPIGVLCIERTLTRGKLSGFVTGLGAATADAFYGAVAAFGLVAISSFLIDQHLALRLVGGTFLLYLGVTSFFSKPNTKQSEPVSTMKLAKEYVSTVFLTVTNPMTILSFAALFAGVGFGTSGSDVLGASTLVLGVFLGSTLWWFMLSQSIGWVRSRVKNFSLDKVNKVSGVVIMVFALFILVSVIKG